MSKPYRTEEVTQQAKASWKVLNVAHGVVGF